MRRAQVFRAACGGHRKLVRSQIGSIWLAQRRWASSGAEIEHSQSIRNVGVIAHIDAGKTTTTERMLYYAGFTKQLGDVDHGSTVMDFLDQERERGITISSAAISFQWGGNRINLVDTPGHVDFTVEVERALRVMDGAVAIVDGVAGVQAQTETVWRQASRYDLPRIVFINKMDREGADISLAVSSLTKILEARRPLLLQHQISSRSVMDLVTLEAVEFEGKFGEKVIRTDLAGSARLEALARRDELVSEVAEVDDALAEMFLSNEEISADTLRSAIKRATITQTAVPVLLGASLRNWGVQPVLDAIIDYLPSPKQRPSVTGTLPFGKTLATRSRKPLDTEPLTALAFKVTHDTHMGAMVHLRVFSGELRSKRPLINVTRGGLKENPQKLLRVLADDVEELSSASTGDIVVAVGLKQVRSGDSIAAKKDDEALLLDGLVVPQPVFHVSIEPETPTVEAKLEQVMQRILREDPSLSFSVDKETGETLLGGMGELHLEIVLERLRREFKLEISSGSPKVAYLETVTSSTKSNFSIDRVIGGIRFRASLGIALSPRSRGQGNMLRFSESIKSELSNEQREAIQGGIEAALSRGIVGRRPICDVDVEVFDCGDFGASIPSLRACAAESISEVGQSANVRILEPIMEVIATVREEFVGAVMSDLSGGHRRGSISVMEPAPGRQGVMVVKATVPLQGLIGYASNLRSLSKGQASFVMRFGYYDLV